MTIRLTRRTVATAPILGGLGLGLAAGWATAAQTQSGDDPGDPVAAAVSFANDEINNQLWDLYRHMYSDARAEVPFFAMQYWYENSFLPRGPQPIEVKGVQTVDWTWPVTGKIYPGTAEVAFLQHFSSGPDSDDVVRLVVESGEWRWFFGRSRDFIDEQIAAASPAIYPADNATPPAWAADALTAGRKAVDALPDAYPGLISDDSYRGAARETTPSQDQALRYTTRPDHYTVASVLEFDTSSQRDAASSLKQQLDGLARQPSFKVLAWDPENTVTPFATARQYTGEVNQDVIVTIVASGDSGRTLVISAPEQESIDAIGKLLAGS